MRNYPLAVVVLLIVPGLAGLYFGLLYTGVECDTGTGSCVARHAGEISWLPVAVGAVFLAFGLLMLWRMLRAR
jgi:hypothetical protein